MRPSGRSRRSPQRPGRTGSAGRCVHPVHVAALVRALDDARVEPVSVVGFPHGAHLTEIKLLEARRAADEGARAVDVVAPLGR